MLTNAFDALMTDATGLVIAGRLPTALEASRLATSMAPKRVTAATGALTTAAQTVTLATDDVNVVAFVLNSGTFSTHNFIFEGSFDGGTTWFAVTATRTNSSVTESGATLSAVPAYYWRAPVDSVDLVRVRLVSATSGTANWRIHGATLPAPTWMTVAGNVTATAAGTTTVGGGIAEDAVISSNPVRIGVRAIDGLAGSMSADNDIVSPAADRRGNQYTIPGKVATATLTNVTAAAATTSLLVLNNNRKGVLMTNESPGTLYLKYGATASLTSYTVAIPPYGYWEMPNPLFIGALDGIWSAASGAVRITELSG